MYFCTGWSVRKPNEINRLQRIARFFVHSFTSLRMTDGRGRTLRHNLVHLENLELYFFNCTAASTRFCNNCVISFLELSSVRFPLASNFSSAFPIMTSG